MIVWLKHAISSNKQHCEHHDKIRSTKTSVCSVHHVVEINPQAHCHEATSCHPHAHRLPLLHASHCNCNARETLHAATPHPTHAHATHIRSQAIIVRARLPATSQRTYNTNTETGKRRMHPASQQHLLAGQATQGHARKDARQHLSGAQPRSRAIHKPPGGNPLQAHAPRSEAATD